MAGIDPVMVSGHSLRAGYVTSCCEHGVAPMLIVEQTRHKSLDMLLVYSRRADRYREPQRAGVFVMPFDPVNVVHLPPTLRAPAHAVHVPVSTTTRTRRRTATCPHRDRDRRTSAPAQRLPVRNDHHAVVRRHPAGRRCSR